MSYYKVQIRRDTEANWIANDPVLLDGEQAYSTDANIRMMKIGDGVSHWSELSYMTAVASKFIYGEDELTLDDDALGDGTVGENALWTANKIKEELDNKQDTLGYEVLPKSEFDTYKNLDVVYNATSSNGVDYTVIIPEFTGLYNGLILKVLPNMDALSYPVKLKIQKLSSGELTDISNSSVERLRSQGNSSVDTLTTWKQGKILVLIYRQSQNYWGILSNVQPDWGDINGVPSTFNPSDHEHIWDDINSIPNNIDMKAVTTTGNGDAYIASIVNLDPPVNGMQDYVGLMLNIIPHVTSTKFAPTLQLKFKDNSTSSVADIVRAVVGVPTTYVSGATTGWIMANRTITVRYTQTSVGSYRWIVIDEPKSDWGDIRGVPSTFPPSTHSHSFNDLDDTENVMKNNISQTMSASLIAGGAQTEATKQVRNIVIMPSGSTDFSSIDANTLIFLKE